MSDVIPPTQTGILKCIPYTKFYWIRFKLFPVQSVSKLTNEIKTKGLVWSGFHLFPDQSMTHGPWAMDYMIVYIDQIK